MSTLRNFRAARQHRFRELLTRPTSRYSLRYEPLENRQLLAASSAAAQLINQLVAQPLAASVSPSSLGVPTGLSPAQITAAYGVNQITFNGGVVGNGKGQTIAIIDADYDPGIGSDLAAFDNYYHLTAPASFTQDVLPGTSRTAISAGWALETSLDVEWAHAIAPAASILLVESNADLNSLLSAVTYAANQPGVSVVSMSWGTSEFAGETADDSVFTTPAGHVGGAGLSGGITFVASSGDGGVSGGPVYPSTSPNVLSVGGTSLNLNSNGSYSSESAWSESGGGASLYEPAPAFQAAKSATGQSVSGRTTPDVSWDASPATGVSVFDSVAYNGQSGWFTVGGTSVGAPSWSALIAIADQGLAANHVGSLSNAQASIYQLSNSDFHSVGGGTSSLVAKGSFSTGATGLGSPIANQLIPNLVALNTPASAGPINHFSLQIAILQESTSPLVLLPATNNSNTLLGASNSTTTNTSSSSSTSTVAITPLSSNTSTSSGRPLPPVILVPPPLPPFTFHIGASTTPVTAQETTSILATDDQPSSANQFGQGPEDEVSAPFGKYQRDSGSRDAEWNWFDIVAPGGPAAEGNEPDNVPVGPPAAFHLLGMPALDPAAVDAVFDLFDVHELTGRRRLESSVALESLDPETMSFNVSSLIGAVAIATGSYRLVIDPAERFRSRRVSSFGRVGEGQTRS